MRAGVAMLVQGAGGGGGDVITPIIWNSGDKSANFTTAESGKLGTNASGSNWGSIRSTTSFTTGGGTDFLFEVEVVGDAQVIIGVAKAAAAISDGNFVGIDSSGWGYYASNGFKLTGGGNNTYGATLAADDVVKVKLTSGGDLEFFKNGTSQGIAYTGLSGTFYPAVSGYNVGSGGRAT